MKVRLLESPAISSLPPAKIASQLSSQTILPDSSGTVTVQADTAPKGVNIEDLFQHWVHSREEQNDPNAKEQIFRPATSRQFPPSRFRMAYKFSPNGECEWMFLDPADGHHFKPSKWEIDVTDGTLLKITADMKTDSFRILELSKDLLRLAPVEPAP